MLRHTTVFQHRSFVALCFVVAQLGASPARAADPSPAAEVDPAANAEAYLAEWNAKGQTACEAKSPDCPKLGETLYNAAAAFQASGQRNKAIMARTTLTHPKYNLDNTEIGKKALFQLAEDYKAIGEYARAAELYEAAAIKAPNAAEAPDALMDATIFRLALGETDKGIKDAELYDKLYGAKKPALSAKIWIGIAGTLVDNEQFKDAKPLLGRIMARVDKDAEIHDKFLAHAWLARTLAKLDDAKGAEKEYTVVRALWKNSEMQKRLFADAEGDPRNLGKVLNVVGEALFFFAEQKRKEADEIRFPEYKGSADKEQVMKHINTKIVDWIKKKRPAIEEAEKAYRQILELQPAPPPRWVVASASRVGQMWAKFVAEFRAAPIPGEWKKNGPIPGMKDFTYQELRKEYYAKIDEATEPQRQQAKASFKVCVDYSVKYQYFDEFSRSCQLWLQKSYGKEFVRIEEFIPAVRSPVLTLGSSSVLPDPRPSK